MSLNDGKLYGVDLRLRRKGEGQLAVAVLPYGACLCVFSSGATARRSGGEDSSQDGSLTAAFPKTSCSGPRQHRGRRDPRGGSQHLYWCAATSFLVCGWTWLQPAQCCGVVSDQNRTLSLAHAVAELVGAFWENNGFGRNIAGSLNKSFVSKVKGQARKY